jgi:TfoX/Sxy family transcriptional regulator of competence genes
MTRPIVWHRDASPLTFTMCDVAYDEALADRVRALIAGESDLTERRMFGGLAFLIGGNMAMAASGQGGLLVRVDPAETDAIVAKSNARPMEMRGKPMQGWLRVDSEYLGTKRQLTKWVGLGTAYARSLPVNVAGHTRPSRGRRRAPQ